MALTMRDLDEIIHQELERMREEVRNRQRFYGSCCSAQMGNASCYSSSVAVFPAYNDYRIRVHPQTPTVTEKVDRRKQLKAEAKAQEMMKDLIGVDQWKVYRETNLVAVKGKWVWLIGDYFKNYNKFDPFRGKPDVIRIDKKVKSVWQKFFQPDRGTPATKFCVETRTNDVYPYTDKVMSFMVQCAHEEDKFYAMANRIGELNINLIPRCALYEGN